MAANPSTARTVVFDGPLPHDPTSDIVRAALTVHRALGSGLEPEMYLRAMELELEERRIRFWRDVSVDLTYKGRRVGRSRVPLAACGVLVGIYASGSLTAGEVALLNAQAQSMGTGGILFNFGAERLEIRRVRNSRANHARGSLSGSGSM